MDNLPALIDGIVRDLAEVRTIEGVLEIRDRAEALLAYAKKHKAAVDMQTGAVQVVLLCERRIGVELEKIPRRHGGDRKAASASPTSVMADDDPPSLAELGFRRDQAAEYVALAKIDPAEIEQAAEEARASGRALTKSAVKRKAAGSRAARAAGNRKTGASSAPKGGGRKRGSSNPTEPAPVVVPESVTRLVRWQHSADMLMSEFKTGDVAMAACAAAGVVVNLDRLNDIETFVAEMIGAARSVRAA